MISPRCGIDFLTHAEEPCGNHADDGYDLQATIAKHFSAPWQHPPTVPETAVHYRARNIAVVIFPVDAERETGFRRYANEEVATRAAENSDALIPIAAVDPAKARVGAGGAGSGAGVWRHGFQFPPDDAGLLPQRPHGLAA